MKFLNTLIEQLEPAYTCVRNTTNRIYKKAKNEIKHGAQMGYEVNTNQVEALILAAQKNAPIDKYKKVNEEMKATFTKFQAEFKAPNESEFSALKERPLFLISAAATAIGNYARLRIKYKSDWKQMHTYNKKMRKQCAEEELAQEQSNSVQNLSADELDNTIESSQYVLVDFYSSLCGPCKTLAPKLKQAAEKHTHVTFTKINCDLSERIASNHNIRGVPTVILYENGSPKARFTGDLPQGELEEFIEKNT